MGLLAAIIHVKARSLQSPWANFEIIFAVAGYTNTWVLSLANWMWPIFFSISRSKSSLKTFLWLIVSSKRGEINSNVFFVAIISKLIDFFSLDVEGSELNVLKGVNFREYNFRYLLIEITDIDKILTIEKATHDKNYSEQELFEFYKRFQFSLSQLINTKESYKTLSPIEGRALLYQRLLLTEEPKLKLELMKILKDVFEEEGISDAFDVELKNFLNH